MKKIWFLSLGLFLTACSEEPSNQINHVASSEQHQVSSQPTQVSYKILSDEKKSNIKRTVQIELERRITAQEIEKIAQEIFDLEQQKYERTFIMYSIKNENMGGAWATSHFDPTLNVKILGSTVDEHQKLNAVQVKVDGKVIGQWRSTWGFETTMVMYEHKNKMWLKQILSDGSSTDADELIKINKNNKQGFAIKDDDNSEYYVINQNGDLEFWSERGNYYTAKKQ